MVADLMANSMPAMTSLKLSTEPRTAPDVSMRRFPVASAVWAASLMVTVPSIAKP